MRMAHITILASLVLAGAAPAAAGPDAARPEPGHPAGSVDPSVLEGVPTRLSALGGAARRQDVLTAKAARKQGYRSLSDLTGGAYPAFTPGVGAVYARRESLPTGPFLAFDRKGRQVSTIYKFPLEGMASKARFEAGGTDMPPVDHVSVYYGGSHPGADHPHYNHVFWHVPRKDEGRVAE